VPGEGRLAGRVVLVAGASRGLGAAIAVACAREAAHTVLLARTRGGLEEVDDAVRAAGGEATLIVADLRKAELVDSLGPALLERFGRLDGLVSCAADLGLLTPAAHLDPALFEQVVSLNLLAQQRLIRSVDPLLRASPAGRAVFLTCDAARAAPAYWAAYAASKAGLEALVRCWAAELRITNARANLLDPGPLATRLRAKAFPGEPADRQPSPETVAPSIVHYLTPACEFNGERLTA
jgi:NAD(P)-dependent dehydrogenase (short-subunit alcohol dehydrogenase family)